MSEKDEDIKKVVKDYFAAINSVEPEARHKMAHRALQNIKTLLDSFDGAETNVTNKTN